MFRKNAENGNKKLLETAKRVRYNLATSNQFNSDQFSQVHVVPISSKGVISWTFLNREERKQYELSTVYR